ncbi:MAG: relaxase/mobilization nuclease domain-containing protein [Muribaculaceae bacterium]|nr:relaxase/mobilization nuclease domain-containing protein [Muribaculaceae bacterium]
MGVQSEHTQYLIARYFDKQHPHCHLFFNRIANDGSVISDSNERRRNEAACRKIKQRHIFDLR